MTTEMFAEFVVVGGGPAGLAAATALAEKKIGSVMLLEREPAAGGTPRHCGHYPFGMRELHRVLRGPDYAARLVARAVASGVDILTRCSVMALHPGPRLGVSRPEGLLDVRARRVILCTGVRESSRVERLIGGTKPAGVLSTGALQGLVYLDKLRPFLHPVIYGSELVSFSALLTCRHLGIRPVALIEQDAHLRACWPSVLLPRLTGIPVFTSTRIESIDGRDQVSGVTLSDSEGKTRHLDCDGVIVSGRFKPEASLLPPSHLERDKATGGPVVDQYGRCSDPDYYAAGNLLRPAESAGWSWQEGRSIAQAAMLDLTPRPNLVGRASPSPATAVVQSPVESDLRVSIVGDELIYVMPQRVTLAAQSAALPDLQFRVRRPVTGRLVARLDGREIAARRVRGLPERRLLLTLPDLTTGTSGEIFVSLEPST